MQGRVHIAIEISKFLLFDISFLDRGFLIRLNGVIR